MAAGELIRIKIGLSAGILQRKCVTHHRSPISNNKQSHNNTYTSVIIILDRVVYIVTYISTAAGVIKQPLVLHSAVQNKQ